VRDLSERLEGWVQSGLIGPEQAEAIARHERERAPAGLPEGPPAVEHRPDRRGLGAEAVGYVGAALAIGAIGLLLGDLWSDLVVAGRLALVGLLTALLAAGGLLLRRASTPPMQRLTSVLFTGAIVGVGWLAFIVADDLLGLREGDVALLIGVATAAAALPAYLIRQRALPQLTLLATLLLTVSALLFRAALAPDPLWAGLLFWSFGIAWLLLGAGGWIRPRRIAEIAGGILALFALQATSGGGARVVVLGLAVLTAGALVTLAITSDRVHHLAVGAVGLFVLVPQLVFEIFGDAIGAPATLLVIGLLLVLLAVGLGRARREVGASSSAPPPPTDDDLDVAVHAEGGEPR
jgi:hypothetical protein